MNLARCLLFLVLLATTLATRAGMRDDLLRIPVSSGPLSTEISARLYAPEGAGPFPLVVINHGKAPGDARLQKDNGFYAQARVFVRRGYAVLVPTRQGFGSSGGTYRHARCDPEKTGILQADDIDSAIRFVTARPGIDGRRIVVIGQSVGGLATMALGERRLPGVLGLIDMAGGIRMEDCPGWQDGDIRAFARYGKDNKTPALMMYGDNDSYWGPVLPGQLHAAYVAAGGQARLIDYGTFGKDSHATFGSLAGRAIWLPAFDTFFRSLGLPFDETVDLRTPGDAHDPENTEALPLQDGKARKGYADFLDQDPLQHRAFAFSADGAWGWASGDDARDKALGNCSKHATSPCQLYAVDRTVVYPPAP